MSPQSKRRRRSLFTLPIVVVIGILIVAKLAAMQRSDLIAELADCISHGESREALEAVRKLSTLPNPPIAVLVTAAAADEHETAGAAQVTIDRLLRRWQRDIELKKRYGTIGGELAELAKALADAQVDFSPSDHAWLESATRKILRIANKFPPAKTPLVATHCDVILTSIGAGRQLVNRDEKPVFDEFDDVVDLKSSGYDEAHATATPIQPSAKSESRVMNELAHAADSAPKILQPPAMSEPLPQADGSTTTKTSDDPSVNELRSQPGGANDEGVAGGLSSVPEPSNRTHGMPPVFRILPAMPINTTPSEGDASIQMRPDAQVAAEGDGKSPTVIESRELLQTWLDSAGGDKEAAERALIRRGFGRITKPLVQQYFSKDADARMRLVDKVLAQPGGGSEAWLILLAKDSNPDVRLFAVTFMATSNNAGLVEKAWQVAIRDADPRVADLAGRLREKREGTLRR